MNVGFWCCFGGADGCILLTMLVDVCPCCCFTYICMLTAFETLSLLQNLVNKEFDLNLNLIVMYCVCFA